MELLRTTQSLRSWRGGVLAADPLVLVPTMGALHGAHLELVRRGRAWLGEHHNGRGGVVVSVFVNPTQFNERADFDRYPRDLMQDVDIAASAAVHAVFAPETEEVYPDGLEDPSPGDLPSLAVGQGLEDEGRPGHFAGVARVLARLYEISGCDAAVFGEKDWQQLQLARATAPDSVTILSATIVRDADGLAASSRNVHLSPEGRRRALAIPAAIQAAREVDRVGEAELAMRNVLQEAEIEIGYATIRDGGSLVPIDPTTRRGSPDACDARVLVAGIVEQTRLLDNAPWNG